MPEEQIDARVAFGPFVLDRNERTLRRRGIETGLPARSLRLLEAPVSSAGKTVSKDRLVEEAWQGANVSDTSLTEAISRLRHALGDEAREPRYVRTVHGRGYRFISPVRAAGSYLEHGDPTTRAWMGVSIAASIVLLGVLWVALAVVDGDPEASSYSAGSSTEDHALVFNPFQGLARLLRIIAPNSEQERTYRLAEVTTNGAALLKYRIPALPLNDLSVDRSGSRLAFSIADGRQSDVWVLEPRRGKLKRVATGGYSSDPVWTPNGEAVALARSRNRNFDLVLKDVDRGSSAQVLLEAPLDQFPESWSQDGRSLLYSERHPETGYDLWLLRQQSDDSWVPTPLVRTSRDEAFAAISPDDRYVAFSSSAGRRPEVFVVDLKGDRAPVKVSRAGGAYPFWSTTGDRLHYVSGDEVWTLAADQLAGDAARASRTTTVAGLYLAGSAPAADRMVVAMLD